MTNLMVSGAKPSNINEVNGGLENRIDFAAFVQASPFRGSIARDEKNKARAVLQASAVERIMSEFLCDCGDDFYPGAPGMASLNLHYDNVVSHLQQIDWTAMDSKKLQQLKARLCERFFELRAFGAELTTPVGEFSMEGPVQFTTTFAYQHPARLGNAIPMARFLMTGHINPALAAETGFDTSDLTTLFNILAHMCDCTPGFEGSIFSLIGPIVIFKHGGDPDETAEVQKDQAMCGQVPSQQLFSLISHQAKPGVLYPASWNDCNIYIAKSQVPKGISVGFYGYDDDNISWDLVNHSQSEITIV